MHSVLAPSSAHIWGRPDGCPGYIRVSKQFERERDNPAADEGTACHEVAESMVLQALGGDGVALSEGAVASNGVMVTSEMVEAAEIHAGFCAGLVANASCQYGVEHEVPIAFVHEECFGTVDFWCYNPELNHLWVVDFKFGFRKVDPFENLQGTCYAAGVLAGLGLEPMCGAKVTIVIVQPRAYSPTGPVKKWNTTSETLAPRIVELSQCAQKAMAPDAPLRSGGHCMYCAARHSCPAAIEMGLSLYEISSDPQPFGLTADQLGLYLRVMKRAQDQIGYLVTGLEQELTARIQEGEIAAGYSNKVTPGREEWALPHDEIVAMGDLMGVDVSKRSALTPNQARKAGIPKSFTDMYAKRKRSIKLAFDDGSEARRMFSEQDG